MRSISTMAAEAPFTDTADLTVRIADPSRMPDWDRYVRHHPKASVYHLSPWRDVISEVFYKDTHYILAEKPLNKDSHNFPYKDNHDFPEREISPNIAPDRDKIAAKICGVLPLVRLKSLAFGDFLVSMPYVNYGGVLADDDAVAEALTLRACELARDLGVSHAELRHSENCSELPVRTDKVTMHLPLTGDSEALWKALGAKRRAQVKRPQKEGVKCTIGGEELLADFYQVFSRKYRDLGVPVYPRSWFHAVLRAFPDATRVFVVRDAETVVAAAIVIGFNGSLEVPWASSLRSADRYGVNMYLYWNMLEFACAMGYSLFDFGRSTPDSGTYRFKKQWGAEPVQLYWHYWLRDDVDIPRINTHNPKYRAAVAVWRRLPVWLTNRLGPHIVGNLP